MVMLIPQAKGDEGARAITDDPGGQIGATAIVGRV